jgi:hypothetical protein
MSELSMPGSIIRPTVECRGSGSGGESFSNRNSGEEMLDFTAQGNTKKRDCDRRTIITLGRWVGHQGIIWFFRSLKVTWMQESQRSR